MRTQSKERLVTKGAPISNNVTSKGTTDGSLSLPKLTITLQNKEYSIHINATSTIEKLALELMLMIYDELLEQELSDESREIHAKICEILLSSVKQIIKEEPNLKSKSFLTQMVEKYHTNYSQQTKQQIVPSKYFTNNSIQSSDHETQQGNQSFISYNSGSRTSFKLYEKAQKSIEKMKKLQKENFQQKSKVEISYCTFNPNISKSQKKIKPKESSNVFNRLYSNADEIKIKNFFKKKEIEEQEEKVNSSFKFVPEINNCSKQIMKLKEQQNQQDHSEFKDLNKCQVSFQASQNSSNKYLNDKSSKKVFQKLYDSSFYENRMNKTLQKIIQEKQNQCPFHPQISAGTKRMAKNLPNLESRLKLYALKKMQKENSESGYLSKSKDVKRNHSKFEIQPTKKQIVGYNKGKGIKNMLAIVKNQCDQNEIDFGKGKQKGSNPLNYRVKTEFFDDSYELDGTPKKLNLQPLSEKFSVQNQRVNRVNYGGAGRLIQKPKFTEPNHLQSRQLQNKDKIFEKIFAYLSMGSKELTVKMISENKNIPVEILQILMPLLKQLAEMDTQLDQEQFVWSLENLYEQLNIQMKAILLSWGLKLFKEPHYANTRSHNTLKHVKTDGSVFQLVQ